MSHESNQIPGIVENKGTVVRAQAIQPLQAQVVQAQVVQAQVVQAQVVGQPTQVIGQPTQVGFQPMLQTPGYADQMSWLEDQQAAQQAWMLYGIGCFLCWCGGPCGPCFWYGVACMHFCKPEAQQKRLQQERTVACVSLWTALISTVAIIGIIILYTTMFATVAGDNGYYYSNSYYDYSRQRQSYYSSNYR